MSRAIHLAGSLTLNSAEESFRKVSEIAGPAVKRLPDGETGARGAWIGWQAGHLSENPQLRKEMVSTPVGGGYSSRPKFWIADGVDPADLRIDNLGYAEEAQQSFALFSALKAKGEIAADARFQVSLPTPLAILTAFVALEAQPGIEPALEAGMLREVDRIAAAIPNDQLAVQWDVAVEFGIMEVNMPFWAADKKAAIVERLVRLGNAIPAGIELGYHLCYGNFGLKHFKEPADTGLLVEIGNAVIAGVKRPVNWLHMPVPIARDDEAYFAPLKNLHRPGGTQLFLGLVHLDDGLEGTRRRIATAARVVEDFGIASECGLSNRPEGYTESILALHREAAAA
jgi:hypothetical protein